MVTHFHFHKNAPKNHHKDIGVQNRIEVIQTGDCVAYPRTEGLSCFPMWHSAALFEAQKNTEDLLKGHFRNM